MLITKAKLLYNLITKVSPFKMAKKGKVIRLLETHPSRGKEEPVGVVHTNNLIIIIYIYLLYVVKRVIRNANNFLIISNNKGDFYGE